MRRVWLVLLLFALVPLRGWAVAGMATSMALGAPAAPAAAAVAAMPCHAEHGDESAAASEEQPAASTHLCLACDLCHAPLALPAAVLPPVGPAPRGSLPTTHPRDTGRLLAACLERPPRG